MLILCVYIMASRPGGVIYTGVTSNPAQRVWQHKEDFVEGYTKQYRIHRLVWYEIHDNMESAIVREKRIKKWKREWKDKLIEKLILPGRICTTRFVRRDSCHAEITITLISIYPSFLRRQEPESLRAEVPASAGTTRLLSATVSDKRADT